MTTEVVLAIDQGTSGTKAIVVDPAKESWPPPRSRCVPSTCLEEASSRTRRSCSSRSSDAGTQALALAARPVGAIAIANQGETVLAWDRDDGRPRRPRLCGRTAAPPSCTELAGPPRAAGRAYRARARPLLLGTEDGLAAPSRTTGGVVTTTDTWLLHQLDRRVRNRRLHRQPFAADRHRPARLGRATAGAFGLADEPLPTIVGCDEIVGTTTAVWGDDGGRWPGPRPAGRAARRTLLDVRAGEVHVRHRRLHAHQHRTARGPLGGGFDELGRLAHRGGTAYCIDGQVYTAASAVRWLTDLGLIEGASRPGCARY